MNRLHALVLPALCGFAAPAAAQDYMSQASDALQSGASYAGVVALGAATEAQMRGGKGPDFRGTGFDEGYVRTQCAGLPRDRARYGAGHRRVVRWRRICRQARL